MKKKKVEFSEIKTGKYFKYYGNIYVKQYNFNAVNIKNGKDLFVCYDAKVIPVTVTIKVKEN